MTSIFFCLVIRDSGYMTTHPRRCHRCLSAQLLVCEKNLSCNWQKHQATLSIDGTLLFLTVDVNPPDPCAAFGRKFSVCSYEDSSISEKLAPQMIVF